MKLTGNTYEILNDETYFENSGPLTVFEFYPGDIIQTEPRKFSDTTTVETAIRIIEQGQWPDRKLYEFKFKAISGELEINRNLVEIFSAEIRTIISERESGQFLYPGLSETIDKILKL
jgi:hypothetical protein